MKTFTPEDIRERIVILRHDYEGLEECQEAADALEYLLQFAEPMPMETAPS